MGVNLSVILKGTTAVSKSVAQHPITKGGALAALVTGGLYIAAAAGIAVPEIAFTIGPVAGAILYKFLPKSVQDEIDAAAQKVADIDQMIPEIKTYAEYPGDKKPAPAQTNLVTKNGNKVGG